MARSRSRLGLLASVATAVRAAIRPGSPSLRERAYAVPRLIRAALRGDYPQVGRGHLALLAAAVLYIVSPIDLIPEGLLSVIGLADDAVVLGWLIAALVNDTEGFLKWERAQERAQEWAQDRAAPGRSGPQKAATSAGRAGEATVSSRVVG